MARKPDPNSQQSIADRLTSELEMDVSRKCVREWQSKGYDLTDIPALKKKLKNQERGPKKVVAPETAKFETESPAALEPHTKGDGADKPLEPAAVEAELAKLQAKLLICDNYEDARTINIQITGIRNVLKELREQGKYILRDSATAAGLQAATASRAAWEKIEDELPPQLEGLTASQMKTKLRDYARLKALELSEVFTN